MMTISEGVRNLELHSYEYATIKKMNKLKQKWIKFPKEDVLSGCQAYCKVWNKLDTTYQLYQATIPSTTIFHA